jgi:predicted DNA-binding transcriptional regulator AlpA
MIVLDELLNDHEAAEMLGLTVDVLQAWRRKGLGPPYVKLGRSVRYRPVDIRAHIHARVAERGSEDSAREGINDPPVEAEVRSVAPGWREHRGIVIGLHVSGRIVRYVLTDEDVEWLIQDLPHYLDLARQRRTQKAVHSESASGKPSIAVSPAEHASQ